MISDIAVNTDSSYDPDSRKLSSAKSLWVQKQHGMERDSWMVPLPVYFYVWALGDSNDFIDLLATYYRRISFFYPKHTSQASHYARAKKEKEKKKRKESIARILDYVLLSSCKISEYQLLYAVAHDDGGVLPPECTVEEVPGQNPQVWDPFFFYSLLASSLVKLYIDK